MKPELLGRNDPRRAEVIGLVRRQVSADNFTKADVAKWKKELAADVVDAIVAEGAAPAPEKDGKGSTNSKKE